MLVHRKSIGRPFPQDLLCLVSKRSHDFSRPSTISNHAGHGFRVIVSKSTES